MRLRKYLVFRDIISLCHIALNPMTPFILHDYVFIGGWKVLDIGYLYLMNLIFCFADTMSAF